MLNIWINRQLIVAAIYFLLAGCQTITVSQYTAQGPQDPGMLPDINRTVETWVSSSLFSYAPRCAIIWPVQVDQSLSHWQTEAIEAAVARHARDVIDRVVDRRQRTTIAQTRALDIALEADRIRLSDHLQCKYALTVRPLQVNDTFVLVWSRKRLGFEIILEQVIKSNDQPDILWSARHAAQHSAGALPLSPLGIASAVVSAGHVQTDGQEIFRSLADTVARRIFQTMPDLRTPLL